MPILIISIGMNHLYIHTKTTLREALETLDLLRAAHMGQLARALIAVWL